MTIPRTFLINDSLVMLENKSTRKVEVGLKDYQKAGDSQWVKCKRIHPETHQMNYKLIADISKSLAGTMAAVDGGRRRRDV